LAIDFNSKVMVTNPTIYHLGRGVAFVGIVAIASGIITHFTGDVMLPAKAWCALGVPPTVIGVILASYGITKP
jgi:hypothetical protein